MTRILRWFLCRHGFHTFGYSRTYVFNGLVKTDLFCLRCGLHYRTESA